MNFRVVSDFVGQTRVLIYIVDMGQSGSANRGVDVVVPGDNTA